MVRLADTLKNFPIPGSVGMRIYQARRDQRMTRQKMEVELGLVGVTTSQSVIYQWESGRIKNHSFETMIAFAKALDVSLDYLAGFQTEYGTCPMNK